MNIRVASGLTEALRIPEREQRACERLLQISIEAVIDVCHLSVTGLRLGLPSEENDLFDKLARAGVFGAEARKRSSAWRASGTSSFANREYGGIDDHIVHRAATSELDDLDRFRN